MIAENNQKPKFNSEDVRYYKYAQYKNVRTSKESESCHYSKSLISEEFNPKTEEIKNFLTF